MRSLQRERRGVKGRGRERRLLLIYPELFLFTSRWRARKMPFILADLKTQKRMKEETKIISNSTARL